ncbi:ABC transporter ATP-binding protein [Streptomyces sp. NPDC046915]|uniref:ABC transporter ATP-binding protein n=1 Tax=Streptomyces sp. NPDC046915 TaxID=3155257 RepID=UPI0033DE503F
MNTTLPARAAAATSHPDAAVDVTGIKRTFGRGRQAQTVLHDITFQVPQGQVVGILGANGAGKTTLIKILATLLTPTAGTARVAGADITTDPQAVRRRISVVLGGDRGLYPRLSARQNLLFFGMLADVPRRVLKARAEALLQRMGLAEAADRRVETFSKGMRQRLHLATGLVTDPQVMLLDEPTIGLDPEEASRLRGTVRELAGSGTTVLLTSHYLLDIDEMTDRVLMLREGRITHDLTISDFRRLAGHVGTLTVRGTGAPPRLPDALSHHSTRHDRHGWRIEVPLPTWDPDLLTRLGQAFVEVPPHDVEVRPVTLDDVFSLVSR